MFNYFANNPNVLLVFAAFRIVYRQLNLDSLLINLIIFPVSLIIRVIELTQFL